MSLTTQGKRYDKERYGKDNPLREQIDFYLTYIKSRLASGIAWSKRLLLGIQRAYASIFFQDNPLIGLLFLSATFYYPNIGASGLLAASIALLTSRILHFGHLENGLHIYNSLLVGLSLGAVYQLDIYLALIIGLGAILAVFLSAVCADYLWRLDQLSPLSLPFVIVALTMGFATQSYSTLSRYLAPMEPLNSFWPEPLSLFFTAVGSAFFSPHPHSGALIFIGVLLCSRYLAFLGITGFLIGHFSFQFLSGSPHQSLATWIGFNFILTSIAIGGFFTLPSIASFLLASLAAALSALITAASQSAMLVYGLPVMALPFLSTTFLILLALKKRHGHSAPVLLLANPSLPEKSLESARLAKVRGTDHTSIALQAPFIGQWQVYQGVDGPHTHQGLWRYALDFYQLDDNTAWETPRSFNGNGSQLNDYLCFAMPILSPAHGLVVATEARLPDNSPGEVNTQENWGNTITIQLANGYFVVLAHLKQHSIIVNKGQWLEPGQPIAQCGNSGRSPQPHLHLHIQKELTLGSATIPFHLTAICVPEENQNATFYLRKHLKEGDGVYRPSQSIRLKQSLHFPVGRCLHYRFQSASDRQWQTRQLWVELSLLGEFRLKSDSGASIAFQETENLIAFYDRQGPNDIFLDAWLLSFGVTPFCEPNCRWQDNASLSFFPKTLVQSLLCLLLRPIGGSINSQYERRDQSAQQPPSHIWIQCAMHEFRLLPLSFIRSWKIHSRATIVSEIGCIAFVLRDESQHNGKQRLFEAQLITIEQIGDNGIPRSELLDSNLKY